MSKVMHVIVMSDSLGSGHLSTHAKLNEKLFTKNIEG
jgi:hypothetical protein